MPGHVHLAVPAAQGQRPEPDALHARTHGIEAWKKGKAVGLRTFHNGQQQEEERRHWAGKKGASSEQQRRACLSGIGCLNQHLCGEAV